MVAEAMLATWQRYGSREIGCPSGPVRSRGDLYAVRLRGGDSGEAMLTSDGIGRSAVVFGAQVPDFERAWGRGDVAYYGSRIPGAFGDHQMVFLKDGSCTLFTRASYGGDTVRVPAAATHLLLQQAISRRSYAAVVAVLNGPGGRHFVTHFYDSPSRRVVIVVSKSGAARVAGQRDERVRPADAGCAGARAFDELAGESRAGNVRSA